MRRNLRRPRGCLHSRRAPTKAHGTTAYIQGGPTKWVEHWMQCLSLAMVAADAHRCLAAAYLACATRPDARCSRAPPRHGRRCGPPGLSARAVRLEILSERCASPARRGRGAGRPSP